MSSLALASHFSEEDHKSPRLYSLAPLPSLFTIKMCWLDWDLSFDSEVV